LQQDHHAEEEKEEKQASKTQKGNCVSDLVFKRVGNCTF